MATLQLQMSVEGQDGVGNLLKIAQHSEERIFQAATDLENYLHTFMSEVFRIATKKTDLASQNALETRPAVPGQVAIRPDSAGGFLQQQQQQHNIYDESLQILQAQQQRGSPEPSTASDDSLAHSATFRNGNESDVMSTKLQLLKEQYLIDMNELYGMLSTSCKQPMPPDHLQKLKHYKDVLHHMIPYLKLPKEKLPKAFNLDKVEAFEKQVLNIMQTFKQRWASFSGGPAGSAQSQTAPSNSGQSQPTPGQQLDPVSLPKKFSTIAATATTATNVDGFLLGF